MNKMRIFQCVFECFISIMNDVIRVFVVGLSVEVSSAVHHLPVSVHDNLLTFPPPNGQPLQTRFEWSY